VVRPPVPANRNPALRNPALRNPALWYPGAVPLPPPPPDLPERVGRMAMIARWKPLHLGQTAALDGLLARAEELTIGIGSANRLDLRNPFTAVETATMLRLHLGDRAQLVEVPDLGDGPRWADMVCEMLGELDLFVTANPWVWSLLRGRYRLCHPVHLVPPARRVPIDGTAVRLAMARGEDWRALVPPAVADWLEAQGLVDRFRRDFGAATLAGALP